MSKSKRREGPGGSDPEDSDRIGGNGNPDGAEDAVDFEAALFEIESIVSRLEGGELKLADSLEQYGRAVGKLKDCHRMLEQAEQRVSMLAGFDEDGNPITESFAESEQSLEQKQAARGRRRGAVGTRGAGGTTAAGRKPPGGSETSGVDDSAHLF